MVNNTNARVMSPSLEYPPVSLDKMESTPFLHTYSVPPPPPPPTHTGKPRPPTGKPTPILKSMATSKLVPVMLPIQPASSNINNQGTPIQEPQPNCLNNNNVNNNNVNNTNVNNSNVNNNNVNNNNSSPTKQDSPTKSTSDKPTSTKKPAFSFISSLRALTKSHRDLPMANEEHAPPNTPLSTSTEATVPNIPDRDISVGHGSSHVNLYPP